MGESEFAINRGTVFSPNGSLNESFLIHRDNGVKRGSNKQQTQSRAKHAKQAKSQAKKPIQVNPSKAKPAN
jgi:hypothetical protein